MDGSNRLNLAEGLALKHAGQQLTLTFAGDWRDLVMDEFRQWVAERRQAGERFITIEQFRAEARSQPDSHKSWGGIVAKFVAAKLIQPTDIYRRAASPRTHAHPVRVWEIL